MIVKKHIQKISAFHKKVRGFEYRHTTVAIFIAFLTVLLIDTALVTAILVWFSKAGYLGAFIGGFMLVSSFTAAPGAVLLLSVANNVNLPLAVLVAAVGSSIGDWLILNVINDRIGLELKPVLKKLKIMPVINRLRRGKFRWTVVMIGAFITMLPMPDEFGVALMGLSNFDRKKVLLLCFFLNILGLTMLLAVGRALTGAVNI